MQEPKQSKYPMISLEEAVSRVLQKAETITLPPVQCRLLAASGKVIAEDVTAPCPFPPFRASILDGYACRTPLPAGDYPIVGESLTGDPPGKFIGVAGLVYVGTGAPVPDGFDAVIGIEKCSVSSEKKTCRTMVEVSKPAAIREIGSDIPAGTVVVKKGTKLASAEIGLLASVGKNTVLVRRRPRIGILSTGSELKSIDSAVSAVSEKETGHIIDSNGPMLGAQAEADGFEVVFAESVRDEKDKLKSFLDDTASSGRVDILISTGGVSMGETDYVKPLLEEGGSVLFGRLNLKPGKPTTVGVYKDRLLVFALPGNPVSAWVTYQLLVVPACRLMQGRRKEECQHPEVEVQTATDLKCDPERPEWHRCVVFAQPVKSPSPLLAVSTGNQLSSRLLSSAGANGLLKLPQGGGLVGSGAKATAVLIAPPLPSAAMPAGEEVKAEAVAVSQKIKCPCGEDHGDGGHPGAAPPVAVHPSLLHDKEVKEKAQAQQKEKEKEEGGSCSKTTPSGFTAAVIVTSDRCSRGEAVDKSGPKCVEILEKDLQMNVVGDVVIVPDEKESIRNAVMQKVAEGIQLVVTSGGTGFTRRDVTPEAVEPLFDRKCSGLTHQMIAFGLQKTPFAGLSRMTCGLIGSTLVLCIPGSVKAVAECLEALKAPLPHALNNAAC
uniref:MoaB/Mog domain-containing protein n=1 Tax=Chromera velia CCMP2878 TaxID=1169474 RepID=A0A0G4G2M2_9ALVE|mmetsp:Transcript_16988/g.34464  ORF Transcript_16988/g.34464 Transcript_16988/m.34464 type:complete len:662 (+) Transcript_16988:181-2166(+)|eukprot:Cvel_19954.t1-p1 / transcript=Cvel_19954.t1 / gene=Cvel_19954 / organism=Chromera_velia_CCMP2878 / gene_product=Molybdopterin biosynthesis protein CNX1, putative / transcript_product=Molybdopterin biosynthesis protein CNX1, putative / location=Cvel_scaffold1756:35261-38500(+) / protein_length=661 / sequence_SO=supercontig / SO=protein_coding / is_pseudo=false